MIMRIFGGFVIFLVLGCSFAEDAFTIVESRSRRPSKQDPEKVKTYSLGEMNPDVKLSLRKWHAGRRYSIQKLDSEFLSPNADTNPEFFISLILWQKPDGDQESDISFTLDLEYEESDNSGLVTNKIKWTEKTNTMEEIVRAKSINISVSLNSVLSKSRDLAVDLVATLYTEVRTNESCPTNSAPLEPCKCEIKQKKRPRDREDFRNLQVIPLDLQLLLMEEDNKRQRSSEEGEGHNSDSVHYRRCISSDLFHNGRPNCQANCTTDESINNTEIDEEWADWAEVQYLLTIIMAGIFFVLCPVCVVFFFLYHRRMNAEARVIIERQRAVRPTRSSEIVVTVSPPDDIPPSYEDLHEIKTPPPTFESVMNRT